MPQTTVRNDQKEKTQETRAVADQKENKEAKQAREDSRRWCTRRTNRDLDYTDPSLLL